MCCLIGGLNSREIEAERDFQSGGFGLLSRGFDVGWPFERLMRVLGDLHSYFPGVPDENSCVLSEFVGLCYEKYQIDDIWDQVERRRELLDLSRRVREIGDAFLRTQMFSRRDDVIVDLDPMNWIRRRKRGPTQAAFDSTKLLNNP